ncbi:MAG: aldehyde dehydrogenase family protein [Dehalococcoidia bacterium]
MPGPRWQAEPGGPVQVNAGTAAPGHKTACRGASQCALPRHGECRACGVEVCGPDKNFEVGSLIVNQSSVYRADHMPYGSVKESGMGREGLRFAMEEMTELKFTAINLGNDILRLKEDGEGSSG